TVTAPLDASGLSAGESSTTISVCARDGKYSNNTSSRFRIFFPPDFSDFFGGVVMVIREVSRLIWSTGGIYPAGTSIVHLATIASRVERIRTAPGPDRGVHFTLKQRDLPR